MGDPQTARALADSHHKVVRTSIKPGESVTSSPRQWALLKDVVARHGRGLQTVACGETKPARSVPDPEAPCDTGANDHNAHRSPHTFGALWAITAIRPSRTLVPRRSPIRRSAYLRARPQQGPRRSPVRALGEH